MTNPHIQKAVEITGSQAALARSCGVSPAAVFKWLNGRRVKADYVMSIVRATGGQVMAHEIRPDLKELFPHPDNQRCPEKHT
ncbi:helix-turn-helix domain-containing protein [Leminorella grimontii]|uniref:transcriptional regulator n=1 Tax=Leminorella grimontii TaxID=82981 RepID=UPI0032204DF9